MYKESFSLDPSSLTPFNYTTVSPIYAEEWHVRPPVYDQYINKPPIEPILKEINKIDDPRDYPYAQYLTITNLLPHVERTVAMMYPNKLSSCIGYINSTFTQHDISFRDNMSRIQKKLHQRRYRHNCNDDFSPFYSF